MNENQIEYEGKTYVAETSESCKGCAFLNDWDSCSKLNVRSGVFCLPDLRKDGRDIIWIEQPA